MPAAGASALRLHPFPALRYDLQHPDVESLDAVTAPTVDLVDDSAWEALAARSRYNVIRLIRPRGPDRHAAAGQTLEGWRRSGVLRSDGPAGIYVYEQAGVDGHVQRGLVGELELVAPGDGTVLPHEDTMAGPVAERLALSAATGADLEMILLLYAGGGAAAEAVAGADRTAGPPVLSGTLADGSVHRVWQLTDPVVLAAIAGDLAPRRALIADGHHRYETYLQRQALQRSAGAGAGPWDRGLAFSSTGERAVPHGHPPGVARARLGARGAPRVRGCTRDPTARVERGLGRVVAAATTDGRGPAFVLGSAAGAALIRPHDPGDVARAVQAGGGQHRSTAWQRLDVTAAHHWLLPVLLGTAHGPADPTHSAGTAGAAGTAGTAAADLTRPADLTHPADPTHPAGEVDQEGTVGYEHDLRVALATVGTSGTVLVLAPTTTDQVLAVAGAGEQMPRKSTLFAPKPRVGVLMRLLDPSGPR